MFLGELHLLHFKVSSQISRKPVVFLRISSPSVHVRDTTQKDIQPQDALRQKPVSLCYPIIWNLNLLAIPMLHAAPSMMITLNQQLIWKTPM